MEIYMTEKLFYIDPYLTEFDATIMSLTENNGLFDLTLDRTAFFPTGGGQPHDDGTLGGLDIVDVKEKNGEIVHTLQLPDNSQPRLSVGQKLHGRIDFNKRFMLMQNHSGEHILSGIVHNKYGYNNVGFHMGSDFITVDFDGPLSDTQIAQAEIETNDVISQNLDVLTYFPSPEELERTDYRSKKELSGDVRLTKIPGVDLCACCGTHVKKTGEIGLLKIVDHINYKCGVRLFILCGSRAIDDYARKNADIYRIGKLLSKKPCEVADGVEHLSQELSNQKYANEQLWRRYVEEKTKHLTETDGIIFLNEPQTDISRLGTLSLAAAAKCKAALAVSQDKGVTQYALASETEDVRCFNNTLCERFCGKGGGRKELCRGTLHASANEIEDFILNYTLERN